ncbi:uncharacterized protein STEHIDRAFT_120539 [Stereum hirsutum FP-91666 SS1]|uniref:uncharacterized protein n=1 Tax=Stereum hirsutum (strain FP-91666) TaxID=721885 RepID=UPI000440B954|nr:uncharacterized protein STEHIDRAFT_120539 [Stereum hirsutum FP-91666 SS1]EIM88359.1 hypothetical protein STEHIDRAFT_120539 [Stereum hirsutum FP-91666 SS1]
MPMATIRARSPATISPAKKPKIDSTVLEQQQRAKSDEATERHQDHISLFTPNLFDPSNIHRLNNYYHASEPYKYALVEKLFQDDLLKNVVDECLSELHFTERETDIYKVNQTGDLASLNYLSQDQIALLPNLLKLRDALYSPTFRTFMRTVTGCGPLSGVKQDMSINTYKKGCHLLNHDDVIGTRRVSYILYMPLPHYQLWQKEWGGALELYPVKMSEEGVLEPEPVPTKSIPPSWNQFIFFEVQPGKSFHSVEEVVVGEGEDGRQRLSISGWFHAAQEDEDGYSPEPEPEVKSSRDQLASTSTSFQSYTEEPPLPDAALSADDISFLSEFLNPVYLQPRTMKALSARFVQESSLELHDFLSVPIASTLSPGLRSLDAQQGLGPNRPYPIPPHTAGTGQGSGWTLKGPPHKWRYCVLESPRTEGPVEAALPLAVQTPEKIVRSLQDQLFGSEAFRRWLAVVSRLSPMRYAVEARRFCPGLGYTLATSEENEARLDVVLGLTPQVEEQESDAEKKKKNQNGKRRIEEEEPTRGWQMGEWGGWECYMAPHDEEDDPAVYRSGPSRKAAKAEPSSQKTNGANGSGASNSSGAEHGEENGMHDSDEDAEGESDDEVQADEEEEEEDGTLLTVQPGFNRLLLVLRDERVMRFVKYVSAAAEGSRWDVCGEYEVGMVEEDDEDDN